MTDQVRATTTEDKHMTTGRINKGRGGLCLDFPTKREKKEKKGEKKRKINGKGENMKK